MRGVPTRCRGCIFRETFTSTGSCCSRVLYTQELRPPFEADGSCPVKDTTSMIVPVGVDGYKVVPKAKIVPKAFLKHYKDYKDKKIKQKDLAEMLGVSRETIRKWDKLAREQRL